MTQIEEVLTADHVVTPDAVLSPGWVAVGSSTVIAVGRGTRVPAAGSVRHVGHLCTPGLVDMHVHGAGGGDMTADRAADLDTAARALLRAGVTTACVSLITAPLDRLEASIHSIVARLRQPVPSDQTHLVGIHLEGPFLSAKQPGAHPVPLLREPDADTTSRLLDAAAGTLRMVTLAPELHGADECIRTLRDQGVAVAAGHTAADIDQIRHAVDLGITVATHLFNGMPPSHHREPGAAMALLEDDRVTVELINDGVHVHPAVARVAARAAGDRRLAIVSDGVAATAAPEGHYRLGSVDIRSFGGRVETADGRSLGGGNATLDVSFQRAVNVLGLDLAAAVQAVTSTPARAVGVEEVAGSIRAGRAADLCTWDRDLRLTGVMARGVWITEPRPRSQEAGAIVGA